MPRFCKQPEKLKVALSDAACLYSLTSGLEVCPFSFCTELLLLGAAIAHQMCFNPEIPEVFPDSLISEAECLKLTQCFVTVVQSVFMGYCRSPHQTQTIKLTEAEGRAGALNVPLLL